MLSDLIQLKCIGHSYSWNSKGLGDGRVHSRIDWSWGNSSWMGLYGSATVDYLNHSISDHTPLLFKVGGSKKYGGKPFQFFNHLADHPSFESLVKEAWEGSSSSSPMQKLWTKLQHAKQLLKDLHHKDFSAAQQRIEQARLDLETVQTQLQSDFGNAQLHRKEKELTEDLKKWSRIEESAVAQKSRVQWLQLGDDNTQFFFRAMK